MIRRLAAPLLTALSLGCHSATGANAHVLRLADGTGSFVMSGTVRITASSAPASDGIAVSVVYRNTGVADTTFTLTGCVYDVLLYTSATGGSPSYSLTSSSGLACTTQAVSIVLHASQEQAFVRTLLDGNVGDRIPAGRYFIRVNFDGPPVTQVAAGTLDR